MSQVHGQMGLGDVCKLDLAVGAYIYGRTSPDDHSKLLDVNRGNALEDGNGDGDPDRFAERFGILHPILALRFDQLCCPLVLSAEGIVNVEAGGQNRGWALGLALGKSREAGDWRFYYQWQVVEREAIFSPFAQDDFLLATNRRSHVAGVNYQVSDHLGVHVWALGAAQDRRAGTSKDEDSWRVRGDLNVKF